MKKQAGTRTRKGAGSATTSDSDRRKDMQIVREAYTETETGVVGSPLGTARSCWFLSPQAPVTSNFLNWSWRALVSSSCNYFQRQLVKASPTTRTSTVGIYLRASLALLPAQARPSRNISSDLTFSRQVYFFQKKAVLPLISLHLDCLLRGGDTQAISYLNTRHCRRHCTRQMSGAVFLSCAMSVKTHSNKHETFLHRTL